MVLEIQSKTNKHGNGGGMGKRDDLFLKEEMIICIGII